jgi:ubiquinone/menaquinone biosynthesis C-methylase UbiE
MSVTQPQPYSAPFDAVAARYDETFTSSKIGQAQRASVWNELANTFRSGDRVLEIGCGTGIDACFMAEHGVRVTACDSSSRMIEVATRRVRETGQQNLVQPLLLRAENIVALSTQKLFDGAFSNFGALNCLEDPRQLARNLAKLLRPGATALLCWMGPYCLWEIFWYLAQWKGDKAFRRLKPEGVTSRIADGAFVRVHYPPVRLLAQAFAPEFQLKSFKGIGVAVPPSYLEHLARRHPHLLQLCERADSYMGRCPGVRTVADHVLLRFQRADTSSEKQLK